MTDRTTDAFRYVHPAAYILVNGLLIAIDLITSPGTYWFIWPLLG